MIWTTERAIPWSNTPPRVMRHHVMRYAWAMRYTAGRRVVDLGCGTGYGSYMLSWVARHVTGVEIDAKASVFAGQHFQAGNLAWRRMDLMNPGALPKADVYVAFEVLEHLDDPRVVIAALDAPLVWSVPVRSVEKYHQHVYSIAQIRALVPGACAYQTYDGLIRLGVPSQADNGYVLGFTGGD